MLSSGVWRGGRRALSPSLFGNRTTSANHGKTLEQLNGEQEGDDVEATAAEAQAAINKTQ
jgi:hypothetical protein